MLPALIAMLLTQSPDSLQNEAAHILAPAQQPQLVAPHKPLSRVQAWTPWQGHLAFQGMFVGELHTMALDTYLGRSSGLGRFNEAGHGGGWFWGYGLHGIFGSTQTARACRDQDYCVGRWLMGPSIRAGRAWGYVRDDEAQLPDGYVYAELTPFIGRTSIDSAPLSPGESFVETGARAALGANFVGWTRLATSGATRELSARSTDELTAIVIWMAVALTNHFEADVELSRGIAGPQLRAGFSIGTGF